MGWGRRRQAPNHWRIWCVRGDKTSKENQGPWRGRHAASDGVRVGVRVRAGRLSTGPRRGLEGEDFRQGGAAGAKALGWLGRPEGRGLPSEDVWGMVCKAKKDPDLLRFTRSGWDHLEAGCGLTSPLLVSSLGNWVLVADVTSGEVEVAWARAAGSRTGEQTGSPDGRIGRK